MKDPTNCDRCKKSLAGDRWVQMFKNDELVETRCKACDDAANRKQFQEDGRLTTRLLTDAYVKVECSPKEALLVDYQLHAQCRALDEVMRMFEKEVWFGGLQTLVRKSKTHGMTVPTEGDFKFLCLGMAGRAMFTLENKTSSVTFITDETSKEPRMGLQGIYATLAEAVNLTVQAMAVWRAGARPAEDREVRIAGT